jgi:hypothetical protein
MTIFVTVMRFQPSDASRKKLAVRMKTGKGPSPLRHVKSGWRQLSKLAERHFKKIGERTKIAVNS